MADTGRSRLRAAVCGINTRHVDNSLEAIFDFFSSTVTDQIERGYKYIICVNYRLGSSPQRSGYRTRFAI